VAFSNSRPLTIMVGLVRAHGQVAPVRHPLQARTAMTGRSAICIAANWRYREGSSSCARSCSVPARRISARPRTGEVELDQRAGAKWSRLHDRDAAPVTAGGSTVACAAEWGVCQ
jgi:hypothetical protein